MLHQYFNKKSGSIFVMTDDLQKNQNQFEIQDYLVKILWNRGNTPINLQIDAVWLKLMPNQIITLTFLHHIVYEKNASSQVTAFIFNKEFYCLQQHDDEVSCNGILFFGAQSIPLIDISGEEKHKFDILYEVFLDEFNQKDTIQGQMLEVLLKKMIIKCTRIAKLNVYPENPNNSQVDMIRKFNLLVEIHFKTLKKVGDYANLLCKSPKTLSNLFIINKQKNPQQIIHDRIILEAKRLLNFSEKSSKEIAFELGFAEASHFAKFFKNITEYTPIQYRKRFL